MPKLRDLKWAKGAKETFAHWFHREITNTFGDRAAKERQWADLIVQWRAALPKAERDFPWPGAANYEFPMTAIHSDPVVADFYQSLHTPEDFWNPVPLRPDRVRHAAPVREFLTRIDRDFLKIKTLNQRALLDQVVLGTCIYKSHINPRRVSRTRVNLQDEIVEQAHDIVRPSIDHIPLQHFYIPADAWNIDPDAPVGAAKWVAQKFYVTRAQFDARAQANSYDREAAKLVRLHLKTPEDNVDEEVRLEDSYQPFDFERIELFEVHARFDFDNDGIEEDIVVVFHVQSMQILRATLNPMLHGHRPFYATRYLPTFGFYGMGMGELDAWSQRALTDLLNANIDNVHLVGTRMFGAPEGSSLIPGEPIYPGRVVRTPPGEQIGSVQLAEIYPSLPQLQQWIMQIAEMRTGVSELRQGNITGLPSRTPASTVLSILREGNKRFDMILSHTRTVWSEMGTDTLKNISQSYMDDPTFWTTYCTRALGQQDAALVIETLRDFNNIDSSFGVEVTASSALVNKEAEKQSFIGMMQLIIPMYQQLVQTALLLQQLPPQSPAYETAVASYTAGADLIQRLIERFDIQNPSQYVGNLQAIADSLTAQGQGQNPATAGLLGGAPEQPLGPYPAQNGLPPRIGQGILSALLGTQ